jgi:tetratricopeptide (TPR) repeat protein
MYEAAFDAYDSSAPLGVGAGNFEFWWARHPKLDGYIVDAHSLYIEALAELGPVGLLLVAGALGWLGWMAIMARRAAPSSRRSGATAGAIGALAVFAVHAGIDWFWEYAALVALALGSAAIAACGRSGSRSAPALPLGARMALVSVAIAMAVIQFLPWSSVRAIRSSEEAIAEGNAARAVKEADRAAGLESWGARPHAQLARAHAAAGDLGPAKRELREAVRREPLNWRHRAQLVGLHRAAGDLVAADAAYRQAERMYRLNPLPIEFVATEMEQLASR